MERVRAGRSAREGARTRQQTLDTSYGLVADDSDSDNGDMPMSSQRGSAADLGGTEEVPKKGA